MAFKSHDLKRVAENLFRDGNDGYVAKIKRGGKIHRKRWVQLTFYQQSGNYGSLRRKSNAKVLGEPKILFDELGARWLESFKLTLKPSSFTRRSAMGLDELEADFRERR
jgi:hypothetical protein